MPELTDVSGVRRFIEFTQYLSKFMAHLADELKPLTILTKETTPWYWKSAQRNVLMIIKEFAAKAPVLRYYSNKEEVKIQCDRSKDSLFVALLQSGQPVCFASRALSDSETRFVQIEKKLLAILFACERFYCFVYRRRMINVKSDHKLLEAIFKKPFNEVPKRLQRMLMRQQRYRLNVRYKAGKEMYLSGVSNIEFTEYDQSDTLRICDDTWKRLEAASIIKE